MTDNSNSSSSSEVQLPEVQTRPNRTISSLWLIPIVAALIGGAAAGITVALVVNLSAALGRLAFDSMLQRDGPAANRGQAFALFETRFQLAWVAAAVVPVLFDLPGRAGLFLVGAVAVSAVINYLAGTRSSPPVTGASAASGSLTSSGPRARSVG